MTTTSLEMSRKLKAAGFFNPPHRGIYIDNPTFSPDGLLRATLDDLVTALGLDKPGECESILYAVDSGNDGRGTILRHIYYNGLTPDTLAQVWIDIQTEGGGLDEP